MTAQLITSDTAFSPVGLASDELNMFHVSEGISAEAALEKASNLLESILCILDDAAMGQAKLEGHHAWLTLHATESAKAIIDALWATIQIGQDGGAQ